MWRRDRRSEFQRLIGAPRPVPSPRPPRRPRRRRAGPRLNIRGFVGVLAVVLAIVGLLSQVGGAPKRPGACRVVSVVDGDTVHAVCPGWHVRSVRLLGYDTPEVFSPSCVSEWVRGTRATAALWVELLSAGEASLVLSGRDRYGRHLGRLFLDGRDVARAMIADGHARPYAGGRRESWCW